jgi:hypothetical protein
MDINKNKQNTNPRDNSIDLIKSIAIVFILLLHLKPIVPSDFTLDSFWVSGLSFLVDFLNKQIFLLSVPSFIIVSLYLYHKKYQQNILYTKKRLTGLLKIFIFWQSMQLLVYFGLKKINLPLNLNLTIPESDLMAVVSGSGPNLPIIGGSVFYFLFVLIILTIVYFLNLTISKTKVFSQSLILVNLIIIVILLIYFEYLNWNNVNIKYYRLTNFFIYVPATYIIASKPRTFLHYRWYYAAVFFLFSCQDYFLSHHGYQLSKYARVSIFFGCLWFVAMIFQRQIPTNKVSQFLSKYSLGLFALHRYFQLLFTLVFANFATLTSNTLNLTVFVATIILSITFVYVLGFTPLKKFVS